jgi:hypothetical protein
MDLDSGPPETRGTRSDSHQGISSGLCQRGRADPDANDLILEAVARISHFSTGQQELRARGRFVPCSGDRDRDGRTIMLPGPDDGEFEQGDTCQPAGQAIPREG